MLPFMTEMPPEVEFIRPNSEESVLNIKSIAFKTNAKRINLK